MKSSQLSAVSSQLRVDFYQVVIKRYFTNPIVTLSPSTALRINSAKGLGLI